MSSLLLYLLWTLLLSHSLPLSSYLNHPPLVHSLSLLLTPPPPPLVLSPPPLHPSDLRGSVTQTESEIEVEVAALVIGELAGELSVLDNSELRSYCVIQLCILLRLLAGTYST